jgi:lipopolysaccharide transport system ATP-binding protein
VSDVVIVFDGVWKKFRKGERHDSLRDLIPWTAKALFHRAKPADLRDQEFWAVRDVSFEVKRGEALGIIGPNGAGKSTTLKLLTRILKPTLGCCLVRGRSGALIEVAAGFHADLTGRENVFLQGAIMGMKRAEIARRFDQIVEFAGVSDFIDTQVKRYSTGMNARLGFSIAAHLDPDALIIDEVLSVGDMAFQQRCVERMHNFKKGGTAIVFVSHNLQAVAELCDQVLYLCSSPVALGAVDAVLQRYVASQQGDQQGRDSDDIRMKASVLADADGPMHRMVRPGTELTLQLRYEGALQWQDVTLGFIIYRSTDRLRVYDGNYTLDQLGLPGIGGKEACLVDFRFRAHLTRGHYLIECHALHNPTHRFLGCLSPAATFVVDEQRTWAGVADVELSAVARTVPVDVRRPSLEQQSHRV